jgi:hypothetical protein
MHPGYKNNEHLTELNYYLKLSEYKGAFVGHHEYPLNFLLAKHIEVLMCGCLGFFEKNIKIRYGYNDRKEGWVNINPKSEYYYAYNKEGADYKFTLKELPLFWKSRISEIDSNPDIDEEETIQYRLKSILEMIYTNAHIYPEKYHQYIDPELETKILNEYLKQYPQYQIL